MKHGINPYSLTVAIEKNVLCILAGMKLNYGNVLGNVSDNSCLGLESIWVCKLHEKHLSTAWKSLVFRLPIKRAGKVSHQWPGSMYRADQQSAGNHG
jgi:hypothetical protein